MTLHSDVSRESAVFDPSSRGVPTADPCSSRESSRLITLDSSGVFGRILLLRDSIDDHTITSRLFSSFKLPQKEVQNCRRKERKTMPPVPRIRHKGEPSGLYEDSARTKQIPISFDLILAYGPIGKYLMHYIVVFSSCT